MSYRINEVLRELAGHQLCVTDLHVLAVLHRYGVQRVNDLTLHCGQSTSCVSLALKRLEAWELIRRLPREGNDRRVQLAQITERGAAEIERLTELCSKLIAGGEP